MLARVLVRAVSFITEPGLIRRILDLLAHGVSSEEGPSAATLTARPDPSVGRLSSTTGLTGYERLPEAAKRYLRFLEERVPLSRPGRGACFSGFPLDTA